MVKLVQFNFHNPFRTCSSNLFVLKSTLTCSISIFFNKSRLLLIQSHRIKTEICILYRIVKSIIYLLKNHGFGYLNKSYYFYVVNVNSIRVDLNIALVVLCSFYCFVFLSYQVFFLKYLFFYKPMVSGFFWYFL